MVVNPNKLIVIIHDLGRCLVKIKNIDIQSIQTTGICDECKKLLLTLTFAILVQHGSLQRKKHAMRYKKSLYKYDITFI